MYNTLWEIAMFRKFEEKIRKNQEFLLQQMHKHQFIPSIN